jgi:hypothetical protein
VDCRVKGVPANWEAWSFGGFGDLCTMAEDFIGILSPFDGSFGVSKHNQRKL